MYFVCVCGAFLLSFVFDMILLGSVSAGIGGLADWLVDWLADLG